MTIEDVCLVMEALTSVRSSGKGWTTGFSCAELTDFDKLAMSTDLLVAQLDLENFDFGARPYVACNSALIVRDWNLCIEFLEGMSLTFRPSHVLSIEDCRVAQPGLFVLLSVLRVEGRLANGEGLWGTAQLWTRLWVRVERMDDQAKATFVKTFDLH